MPPQVPPPFFGRLHRKAAQPEPHTDIASGRVLADCLATERELARVRAERDQLLAELSTRPPAATAARERGLARLWHNLVGSPPQAPAPPDEVHLDVDTPPADTVVPGDDLLVSGWTAGTQPIVRVDILVDEVVRATCRPEIARPDVVASRAELAGLGVTGFSASVPLADVTTGAHVLRVRAIDGHGLSRECTRGLWIEHPQLSADRPACRHFAVYSSSLGNYFFGEIRDLIADGLRELGLTVDIRDERHGFSTEADWHVAVAPHELFQLGGGPALVRDGLPDRLIIVNTEQPSTVWFALAREHFARAHAVWDINFDSAERLRREGVACHYLPLGYSERYAAHFPAADLPLEYGTSSLEPDVRTAASARLDYDRRPIELFFIGHLSDRREQFLAQAAPVLAKHRCYIHLSSVDRPVVPGQTTHMSSQIVAGLVQRSKIVLNLHHGADRYFEWHRIVLQGIWHGALVVTEPCGAAPPFRSGFDFIELPLDAIPAEIERLLTTTDGAALARRVIAQGQATLSSRCRLADSLRAAVVGLYGGPAFPPQFFGNADAGAALQPPPADIGRADTASAILPGTTR